MTGKGGDGVRIDSVNGNMIAGDIIGADAAGTSPLPNGGSGINITDNASSNTLGSDLGDNSPERKRG